MAQSGLIAGAWLVGVGGLAKFLNSDGMKDPVDGNNTPVSQYLQEFSQYTNGINPSADTTPALLRLNTMSRRILVLSMVLVSMASIAAPAVQDGDVYAMWPRAEKPFWNPHKVPESLCDTNKEIISYTCELVNQKMVSVCASRNLTPETGYIVYRYGLPGNIELAYPKELRYPRYAFYYSNIRAPSESIRHLSFYNKPYMYTVFADWNVGGAKGNRAGVSVSNWDNWDAKNGHKIVFQKMCKDNSYYTTVITTNRSSGLGTDFVFDDLDLRADEFFVDKVVVNENSK